MQPPGRTEKQPQSNAEGLNKTTKNKLSSNGKKHRTQTGTHMKHKEQTVMDS